MAFAENGLLLRLGQACFEFEHGDRCTGYKTTPSVKGATLSSEKGQREQRRRGVRVEDLPASLVLCLSTGEVETRTWTEWMGVDTARLAGVVANELEPGPLREALLVVAPTLTECGILERLTRVGSAITLAVPELDDPAFELIAKHRAGAVRQWAAYSVNDARRSLAWDLRLEATLPFAADPHMSVRECAWMAFRPFLLSRLELGLSSLLPVARSPDPRQRRFAIEVSRPRSVWGKHCEDLKRRPELGRALLEEVRHEDDRYVRLAVGNWINDASKTRPDWAQSLCAEWARDGGKGTDGMIKRGLRTLNKGGSAAHRGAVQASFAQLAMSNLRGG